MGLIEQAQEKSDKRFEELLEEFTEKVSKIILTVAEKGRKSLEITMFSDERTMEEKTLFRNPHFVVRLDEKLEGFKVYEDKRKRVLFNDTLGPVKVLVIKW